MDEPNELWVDPEDVTVPDGCDEGINEMAAELASTTLFLATGGRYPRAGTATVRPCARRPAGGPAWGAGVPRTAGMWQWHRSWGSCACGAVCGCDGHARVGLGFWPILSIDEVWVGGVQLDASVFRLEGQRWLVRIDGQSWPATQDVWADRTEPDTFEVSLTWGADPPRAGLLVAKYYADQLARGLCGSEDCDLPNRVTAIIRQGVTVQLAGPDTLLEEGLTGVRIVDDWIRQTNGGLKVNVPAVIVSPETIGRRVPRIDAGPTGS